jgi:hypothetical protein
MAGMTGIGKAAGSCEIRRRAIWIDVDWIFGCGGIIDYVGKMAQVMSLDGRKEVRRRCQTTSEMERFPAKVNPWMEIAICYLATSVRIRCFRSRR